MTDARSIVVTGASGFVGNALLHRLAREPGRVVHGCYRAPPVLPPPASATIVGELGGDTDWRTALAGADAVVHTAAHAHQLGATSEADYHRVNVDGTLNLARQAVAAGVRRFVFLSSVKVNGEAAPPEHPYRESDPPAPLDAYGRSKRDAELGLAALARETGLEVVVVRPPLVFGPGARGNLERLMRLVARGVPLPLGGVRNRRSMIALGNLCGAISVALDAPSAAGGTFLLAEREDLSTAELVRRIAAAMGRRAFLLPVPEGMLRAAGAATGRTRIVERLVGSLCIDSRLITETTHWEPSAEVARADLASMASSFLTAGTRLG